MRFMVIVKATKESEAGVLPDQKLLAAMGKYNEEKVKSKAEAIDWLKRCPNPFPGESEIEIRQVFEAEDFGAEFTPELREQEERLRAQMATKT